MLKTVLGKVVVGAVAFSSIATHAANLDSYFVSKGAGFFAPSFKVDFSKEGLYNKLVPNKLTNWTNELSGNVVLNPNLVWGQTIAIEGFYMPSWSEGQIAAAGDDAGLAAYAPTGHLGGAVVKINVPFISNESWDVFGQIGGAVATKQGDKEIEENGTKKTVQGTIVNGAFILGGGVNYHIDGNWYATASYKHFLGSSTGMKKSTGITTIGVKYNF